MGENFAEHREIQAEGGAEAEAFGEAGGVDVHDHVDERLHLRGLAGGADVAEGGAEIFEDGLDAIEGGFFAGAHEIERAVAGLGNRGSHAAFEGNGADGFGAALNLDVDFGRERGAVDKGLALGANEE